MRIALFYHSVRSDWNHGNAHFLRGLVRALDALGHQVTCYEEKGGWSVTNLVATNGMGPLVAFRRRFPFIKVKLYHLDEERELARALLPELLGTDLCIAHEWSHPHLLRALTELKRLCGFTLLYHDTHYRVLTQPKRVMRLPLDRFDGVLAYGPVIAERYRELLDRTRVFVWHEAADTALFRPLQLPPLSDVLFIGNWSGGDRAKELRRYLLRPCRRLKHRRFVLHGVRYPPDVERVLRHFYGADFRGWLPNHEAPRAYAQTKIAIHVPRQQYTQVLHGTPTIRVFEALACGATLVSAPWYDVDGLFLAGRDYLMVDRPDRVDQVIEWLCTDEDARHQLGESGAATVRARHTCLHRARELLRIVDVVQGSTAVGAELAAAG